MGIDEAVTESRFYSIVEPGSVNEIVLRVSRDQDPHRVLLRTRSLTMDQSSNTAESSVRFLSRAFNTSRCHSGDGMSSACASPEA